MLDVLFEDNHLIAVNKPAGLLTQGDDSGDASLLDLVREDLRVRYRKPGKAFVGLLHRLDRPVSGVVLFAKTSKAAARLSDQFRARLVQKSYLALVEGALSGSAGTWEDWLLKDATHNLARVVAPNTPGARQARLAYECLRRSPKETLVELRPITGRSHQLRAQLASRGHPIRGDLKYGGRSVVRALDGGMRIALHAQELRFRHPTRGEAIAVRASVPADWPGDGLRG